MLLSEQGKERFQKSLMNQKAEKPSLSGQRLKTRKRDEKEKYDPNTFRDELILGLNKTDSDLEQVSKFLDAAGGKLDYRRYAEVLFDVLFAGGILAPGGSIVQDPDQTKVCRTDVCLFTCGENREKLKAFHEVFFKLIRRYKYLERNFEEEIKKILLFLIGFKEDETRKLAIIIGMFLSTGLCSPKVLVNLFGDHLVKEGISLDFATLMFRSWLEEREIATVCTALKKSQLDNRLLELFPLNKRSQEAFLTHFQKAGLESIADFQRTQQMEEWKKEIQKRLKEMMKDDEPVSEMVTYIIERMQKYSLQDEEAAILVWKSIMAIVEWNKKEELVADQALKHLKVYMPLLQAATKSAKSELELIIKIQEYCYERMNFMKVFQKIILLMYKMDVLSEYTIMKWYKGAHSSKGKSVFLEQMKKFVEWLENAEEESDDDEK
ncbi:hypothetical protein ScPMuIL_013187 [Solemya velum]